MKDERESFEIIKNEKVDCIIRPVDDDEGGKRPLTPAPELTAAP